MSFKDYLSSYIIESSEAETKFTLKPMSFSGKSTIILKLPEAEFDKIKSNFKQNNDKDFILNKTYNSQGSIWTLHANKSTSTNLGSGETSTSYRIYGVSGDYTFGGAPTYFKTKLSGNVKAATDVFNKFISDYLK